MREQSKCVFFLILTLALFTLVSSQLGLVVWVGLVEASPDPPSTGLIAYGEGTVATPRYRRWDGSTLGSEQTGPTMAATIRYVVLKSNPTKNERMLVVSEDGGDVYASVLTYGAEWGTVKTLGTAILIDAACRGFHVAYEQSSGDCMIVVRSGADVKYWIWEGSSWAVDGATLDLTVTTANPVWIKLAPDPGSDEIAMIWLDDTNGDVGGAIWSGSAWGNQQLLESDDTVITSEMLDKECIAVEYMANNGKAMFTWGADNQPSTNDCAIGTRVWNGASWDAQAYIMYAAGRDNYPPFWLSLKANPNSNELMLAVTDDDSDFNTIRWSGTAWDAAVEHETGIETETSRCADVEWENASGHSGHAIVAWADSGVDSLDWRHWDGSSWSTESTTAGTGLTDQYIVQLRRTGDGKIFVSMVDDGSDLHVWYWDSASAAWTTSGSGLGEIETSVSGGTLYEPFEFAPDLVVTLPPIYVHPSSLVNHNLGAGQSFSVEVKVADFIGLYGTEFKLAYDTSVLTATNIDVTGNIFIDGGGTPDYAVWVNIINDAAGAGGPGKGLAWLSLTEGLGEPLGVNGSGLLGTITFTVDDIGESNLEFIFTEIVDKDTVDIPHDIYDGYFANAALIRIDPVSTTVNGTEVSTFYVDVNVTWAVNLRSYEFNITYNTNILIAADVLQGDIFSGQPLTETINDAQGWVFANSTRATDFTGEGTLAQIEFHPDYATGTSALQFFQADLVNATGSIPRKSYNGSVTIIGATVSVSPSYQEVDAPFTSNITVEVAVFLYTWQFNLTYNTNVLTATAVTFGPFLRSGGSTTNSSTINDAAGWVWANSTLTGAVPGVNGSGTLATINFNIDAIGTSSLSFQEAKLAKPLGVPLPCSTVGGSVSVTSVIPEFPLGAAVEIALAVVIVYVWWKRRDKVKTSRTHAPTLR